MATSSIITDRSDREDTFEATILHVGEGAPQPIGANDLSRLLSAIYGEEHIYEACGMNAIIDRFDEMITNNEQPFKTILERVINLNTNTTVYDYCVQELV